ncbi:MAG: hypothetical protein ACLPV8_18125 [Steroidobacteraceae bacterium]
MQTAIIYTFSNLKPGETFDLWVYTNDWGTFDTFQVAPSYNQGYNQGRVSITSVVADMPVNDPSLNRPQLIYIVNGINQTSIGDTQTDVYRAWQ